MTGPHEIENIVWGNALMFVGAFDMFSYLRLTKDSGKLQFSARVTGRLKLGKMSANFQYFRT